MSFLVQLAFFLVPLVVFGLLIGRTVERRHFRNLDQRESKHQSVLVTQLQSFPNAVPGGPAPMIVMSEVVIASDYLKSWLSGWRKLFGGEMRSFRTLQERAKREAVLRLTERAVAQGFNAVCNVRISGADIGGNTAGRKVPMAAIIATGTAYRAGSTLT
jgi:uncharacterized protein YbjQ (UPF0145 family)